MNIKTVFIIVVFVLGIWGGFFAVFINHSLSLKPESPETKTDAIVVLTGGSERIDNGLELFANNMAEHLFITGVHPDVSLDKITSRWTGSKPLPKCCITLGHTAISTFQNAQETKKWVKENKIKSIRLVTSDYHMPRSKMEFTKALPGVKIIAHPIKQKDFKIGTIWFWKVFSSEFHKIILRFGQQLFEPSSPTETQM